MGADSSEADQDSPLKQLTGIILLLHGQTREEKTYVQRSVVQSEEPQDFSDDESTALMAVQTVIPVYSQRQHQALCETVRNGLLTDFDKLGQYLRTNEARYNAGYLANISQKSYAMVIAINHFIDNENEDDIFELMKSEGDQKAQVVAAIKEFQNAFRFTTTKDIIIAGLAGAVLGAVFGLVGPFGIIPTVVFGGSVAGMGTAAVLKRLYLGDTAKLEEMANAIETAANKLLVPESVSDPINMHSITEENRGFFEKLTNCFCFSAKKISGGPIQYDGRLTHEEFERSGNLLVRNT